jgi:hypothetical protein
MPVFPVPKTVGNLVRTFLPYSVVRALLGEYTVEEISLLAQVWSLFSHIAVRGSDIGGFVSEVGGDTTIIPIIRMLYRVLYKVMVDIVGSDIQYKGE